jgi:predicted MFS family arabinose efflux permease
MSCQGYVIDNTNSQNRSQGIATFVGAIMVSEICAPAMGGILADTLGFQAVFVLAAFMAMLAAALAMRTLSRTAVERQNEVPSEGHRETAAKEPLRTLLMRLARDRRFVAIAVFAGIPAKLLHSGFLVFLVPVILTQLGSSSSEIGRYAMLYGVLAWALTPIFSRLTDRFHAHVFMVAAGGIITGLGMLPILLHLSPGTVLLGIGALGWAQSMSIAPQLALITRVATSNSASHDVSQVLGVFRLIERTGGALGPAIAAALMASFGAPHAMALLGATGLFSSLVFIGIYALAKPR